MSFVSGTFVIFFLVVLLATALIDRFFNRRVREIFLLAASYFFYGCWDWRFCSLLLIITLSSYFSALFAKRKTAFTAGIVIPLVILCFFKYFNFFTETASAIFGAQPVLLNIILPVGISFYTFQSLSYVIDVKRGVIDAERDFIRLALFIGFFPQLVAGPIVRASDFLPQLHEERKIKMNRILEGVQIMVFGAFKKLVIADHIAVFCDKVFLTPESFHWLTLLLCAFSYAIQIYMDFSGYSDIATGCAVCLGYHFKQNFNLPYLSQSFTELWSRWHISMSGWFTDYVFVPMASLTKKKALQIAAIIATMFLSGLWHGAGWSFVLWGTILGVLLAAEKLIPPAPTGNMILKILRICGVFFINGILLILFRAGSVSDAFLYYRALFSLNQGVRFPAVWSFVGIGLVLIAYAAAVLRAKVIKASKVNGFYPIFNLRTYGGMVLFFIFCGLTVLFAATGNNPFIYFDF